MNRNLGIFDASNEARPAVIIRGVTAFLFGILFIAGAVWADHVSLHEILWRHWGWTLLGALVFLVLFQLVSYAGTIMVLGAQWGLPGFLLGAVIMLFFFFLRSIAFAIIVYKHRHKDQKWGKGEHASDAAYQGLIGGYPSKRTGFWSLPIKMGSSSGSRGGGSSRGGRFGGGGTTGRY